MCLHFHLLWMYTIVSYHTSNGNDHEKYNNMEETSMYEWTKLLQNKIREWCSASSTSSMGMDDTLSCLWCCHKNGLHLFRENKRYLKVQYCLWLCFKLSSNVHTVVYPVEISCNTSFHNMKRIYIFAWIVRFICVVFDSP